ncbi:MAG: fatty acid desaturase [Alphaproteobacteria bacterium]|nr:fatty acid desaturase [Alphaproteobacteria bacterium]
MARDMPDQDTASLPSDDLIHAAASLTRDLHDARRAIYWTDFVVSAAAGYVALTLAIAAPGWARTAAVAAAAAALYRAVSFVHELTHLRPKAVPGFHTAWNLMIGVPLLLPSFMYEGIHTLHHTRTRYGTDADPEYLPLAKMRPWTLVVFLAAAALAPLALFIRYALLAPFSLVIPPLRRTVVEQFSALAIRPGFRRPRPEGDWLVWEVAASLWAVGLLIMAATGVIPLAALAIFLAVASGVAVLNQLRTLAAHLWENDGGPISVTAQYLDSVNIPRGPLAALWAPVGLRFHALHHLLPGLPYHALGEAHRRLETALPPDSAYHRASHKGLLPLLKRLATASVSHPRGAAIRG